MQENPIDDISVIQHDKDVYQNGTKVHAEAGVEASKQPQMPNQVSAAI
ncbi:hypothetical protein [Lentilactobacillus parabuchneri]|jgi:hypothetical protein|nr:hypothetical protein [Lentilactobacillus parabuchneri]MCW4398450.1 hypothetical protein [Lentilactobacillus parabuchneri]MDB1103139.1 hypothetical protein [Lentilactobacillus parabuchneri]MDN6435025.1 hypothetical protein [Lentilactobacillus parabuchneri]MDN6542941.1 hypothetical protein [Lentilactobacillus parabuchneri]MDN6780664.1 hypothetical protein [Lentilactobacillus parabuchneri]